MLPPAPKARKSGCIQFAGDEALMSNIDGRQTNGFGSPGPAPPTRRSFLDYLLGSTALATLGAIAYPIFKFMSPPQVVESAENSVYGAMLIEVRVNSGKVVNFW